MTRLPQTGGQPQHGRRSSGSDQNGGSGRPGLPLEDLRVTEAGCGLAGAFCGRLLAGLGATVWKTEPPAGDPSRGARVGDRGPHLSSGSALFDFLNAGKKSVTAALGTTEGRSRVIALAKASDVVIYSEPDGAIDGRLGSQLRRALRPGAVLLVIEPFGGSGPYAHYQAVPMTYQALAGYMYIMGDPRRQPLAFPGQQPYYAAGLAGFAAALAALRSGRLSPRPYGSYIVLSIHETVPMLSLHTLSLYTYEGKVRRRNGNRWVTLHPITTYACSDGWILLALPWEHWWERFCVMIGRPELADDPRYAGGANRLERAEEVDAIVSEWLKDKSRDEVVATLDEWGLPKGPCLELDEVLRDEHLRSRGYFEEIKERGKPLLLPGLPFTRDAFPWRIGSAPGPGEHTDEVMEQVRAAEGSAPRPAHGPYGARTGASGPPLAGLRVVDLTWVWAGPLATRMLADLGAEVIKIEFPSNAARPVAPWNVGSFHELNRNKKSVVLDLSTDEGSEVFQRLVKASDLVVENFRPRVMANWGFDYRRLEALNSRVVLVSMPGFGSSGPFRDAPSVGPTIEALAGVGALLGYDEDEPYTSAFAYPDPVSSMWALCGALAGLHWRERTGCGCHVDVSQHEATITMFGECLIDLQRTGVKPARLGNRHAEWAPHGCYPCAGQDRWITIAVRNDGEWTRLREAMGDPAWSADGRFADAVGRRRFEDELDERISDWARGWEAQALTARLQAAGIAAGYVADGPALLSDPQLEARRFFVRLDQPGVGERPYPSLPFAIDGVDPGSWRPSPELGHHTQQVLEEILSMAKDEAEALAARLKGDLNQPARFVG